MASPHQLQAREILPGRPGRGTCQHRVREHGVARVAWVRGRTRAQVPWGMAWGGGTARACFFLLCSVPGRVTAKPINQPRDGRMGRRVVQPLRRDGSRARAMAGDGYLPRPGWLGCGLLNPGCSRRKEKGHALSADATGQISSGGSGRELGGDRSPPCQSVASQQQHLFSSNKNEAWS